VTAPFYPATEQAADDGEPYEATVGEMVDDGTIGKPWIAYYLGVAREWYERIGVDMDRFRFRQHLSGERAHYAADCWDAEAEVDGDWIELGGFAYRSDYDLSKHDEYSDDDFTVFTQYDEPITTEQALVDPDMSYLGPEFGGAAQDVADALANLAERESRGLRGRRRRRRGYRRSGRGGPRHPRLPRPTSGSRRSPNRASTSRPTSSSRRWVSTGRCTPSSTTPTERTRSTARSGRSSNCPPKSRRRPSASSR